MPDRLAALLASHAYNGIDFVEIASPDQATLVVHFLNQVPLQGTLTGSDPVTIAGGESVPAVPVRPVTAADWAVDDDGRPLLTLTTGFAGDFSAYLLAIASPALDPFYAAVRFTFKAGCPSTLDCARPAAAGSAPGGGPVIDYLAKDFTSFRRALLDYSASAYPDWVERDEPDLGMMLVELLSAVGDDLSYLQDRVASEATLETATQMRSLIRHARLVDYEPRPATSARVLLQVDVSVASLPAGGLVLAPQPDGTVLGFELGDGLLAADASAPSTVQPRADPRWNRLDHTASPPVPRITPYLWDDSQRVLPAGSVQTWARGHGFGFEPGTAILIDTTAPSPVDPPAREVVHLTGAHEETDTLYNVPVTRLTWDPAEALSEDHDLTRTVMAGNLIAASEGRRYVETFDTDAGSPLAAVTRTGPDGSEVCLHTLTRGRLAWLDHGGATTPEVTVVQLSQDPLDPARPWRWRRRLLDADLFEEAFTVDPVRFTNLRADGPAGPPWWEYDGDDADSLRFGDGTFGERPPDGATFQVTYRVTAGAAGNVAADTVVGVDQPLAGIVLAVTNPFPATGGTDAEPADRIRARAPYAFRARQFRAVRAEDYTAAAEELDWVLDAGTTIRWTGSWLTVFTTAQPAGTEGITVDEHLALAELLGRRRLAGYEVYSPSPRYAALDLVVAVCAEPRALRGEVAAAVLAELGAGRRADGRPAFFAPGQFRFGAPLERSQLEAAVQRADGVDGVTTVRYRRRGHAADYAPMPETVTVGRDEIIRADSDPSFPDRGSVRVTVEGGK
jgi:hypothetical protein